MNRAISSLLLAATTVLSLAIPSTALAELKPEEVGVIAMAVSRESRILAEEYVAARGIPKENLFLLEGKPAHTVSRAYWDEEARPAIRTWLKEPRDTELRCLVTCWDVPLKIERQAKDDAAVASRRDYLQKARDRHMKAILELLEQLESLARGEEKAPPPLPDDADVKQVAARFDTALAGAQRRLAQLDSAVAKKSGAKQFEQLFLKAGGISALVRLVQSQDSARLSGQQSQRVAGVQGQLLGLRRGLQALSVLPESTARDAQILSLVQATAGILGSVRWIDQQLELLQRNESYASFDSELSMILLPEYPLLRWQSNFLHYAFDALAAKPPVMMVARLAAPSLDRAEQLFRQAIEVEKQGLTGKVYLDARGMGYNPDGDKRGSYGSFDQSLRDLAERLQEHTELEVVLNNEAALFQPGDCPDAALYCGWYSLGRYVDAFDWVPGAVGYHLASMEAQYLRKPGNTVWCNAMLEDGVTATTGPVAEPYLAAFPLPDDFFPMLLTGRYTLAETYYRTKPYNSWVMVLVGDPLYNPFKNRPLLDEEALPDRLTGDAPIDLQEATP
jgi:uncharacterized protein (TIGR03790 family)